MVVLVTVGHIGERRLARVAHIGQVRGMQGHTTSMNKKFKAAIKETSIVGPLALGLYRSIKDWRFRRFFRGKSRAQIFTQIYERNFWSDPGSRSGAGSNLANTESIRRALPAMLSELAIGSMLDIPCGDFNWMKEIDLGAVNYVGADIVPKLIARNNQLYRSARRSFVTLDLVLASLPRADLILCRDCLVHLSFGEIFSAIENMRMSGATYVLTTHFPNLVDNQPLPDLHWRPLNFERAPFHFPGPLRAIVEEENGKTLSLWTLADIPRLPRN